MRRLSIALACLALAAAARPALAETDLERAQRLYEEYLRARLPSRLTGVLDVVLGAEDLRRFAYDLYDQLARDPFLSAALEQLRFQYRPHLEWTAYAGAIADSTPHVGAAVGASVDLAAPLCRYLGAAIDAQPYAERSGSGVAFDGRLTGCIPWGPFSIELGYRPRRSARVGLSSAPLLRGGRFDGDAFEMRLRAFRWIEPTWEIGFNQVDVEYEVLHQVVAGGEERDAEFHVDGSFFRWSAPGRGLAEADRVVDVLAVEVTGTEDDDVAQLNAYALAFAPVRLEGLHLAPGLFLDASGTFELGRISSLTAAADAEPLVSTATGGFALALRVGDDRGQGSLTLRRRLLPDSEQRLLVDERAGVEMAWPSPYGSLDARAFAARTGFAGAAPGADTSRGRVLSGGAAVELGHPIPGNLYFSVGAEATRSFYANAGEDRLEQPAWELRATATLGAPLSGGN